MIPKIVFQVSKNRLHPFIRQKIAKQANGWSYKHFNDNDILQFFKQYPIVGLENIIEVFMSIKNGAHKSDLFRYYFLFLIGGVYLDTDFMVYQPLNDICQDYDFITCKSSYFPNTFFQGFIGAAPGNKVIYTCLKNLYDVNKTQLEENYFWVVSNLFQVFNENPEGKYKLYLETYHDGDSAKIIDENKYDQIIGIHYYRTKLIPINDPPQQNSRFKVFGSTPLK